MKNSILLCSLLLLFASAVNAQGCKDINTQDVVNYLNREIRPTLDLKLDRNDGFLAIKRQRQDLRLHDFSYKKNAFRKTWKYSFQNVRRVDSNFFYDSNKNLIALDVKFESDGPEIKGICPACADVSTDRRAPDINWTSVQILRIYLKPVNYDNSVSFAVDDINFIGDFEANGLLSGVLKSLVSDALNQLKSELRKAFSNGQTKRLFSNALRPLLRDKNVGVVRSVSFASTSMRTCN